MRAPVEYHRYARQSTTSRIFSGNSDSRNAEISSFLRPPQRRFETRFPIISNAPQTPLHTMYDERSAGAPGQPADAAKSLAGICYEKLALYESPLLSANNRTLRKLSFLFVFCSLSSERAARVRKNCTNQLNLGRVHYGKDPKDLSQTATRLTPPMRMARATEWSAR